MRKRITRIAIVAALVATAPMCSQPGQLQDRETSPLVGEWRMVSLEVGNEGGALQEVPYSGEVIFTDAGRMSVQAMDPAADPQPSSYTVNGYEAFYGPVTIDYASNTFVVTVESSAVRGLIGQSMQRTFEVSGNRLVLMPADPAERFRVTYERYEQ